MGSIKARIWLLVAVVALVAPASAHATFPGVNGKLLIWQYSIGDPPPPQVITMNPDGSNATVVTEGSYPAWSANSAKIAYVIESGAQDIATVNPDGTGSVNLTNTPYPDIESWPTWSPDSTKIAFTNIRNSDAEIYVMNADGGGRIQLTDTAGNNGEPAWSPDGTKIAFTSSRDGVDAVYTMNPDGSGQTRLTLDRALDPSWSSDSSKILFVGSDGQIYWMYRDGTGQTPVTSDQNPFAMPVFSPDRTRIAAQRYDPNEDAWPFVTMTNDGTGITPIRFSYDILRIDWGAVAPTYTGYPRPKGATPLQVFLVPAYASCSPGGSNRTHGGPLAFPSCAPPSQTSGQLTVGTPDANQVAANSVAKVFYAVHAGDLEITTTISDVRNRSDLSDYTGELSLASEVRITDKNSTPGAVAGTVVDTTLPITIPCTGTVVNTIGSNCNLATSVNTLYPGAITSGQRSIWQVGQVKAYDGGADGLAATTAGNTLFMDEGLFIP
jgi:WD40-like Beta Propeller Repeat